MFNVRRGWMAGMIALLIAAAPLLLLGCAPEADAPADDKKPTNAAPPEDDEAPANSEHPDHPEK